MVKNLLNLIFRHKYMALTAALLACVAGVVLKPKLPIRLSISQLLPEDRPSVVEMQNVASYVGGVGYLVMILGPTDNPTRYLHALSEELRKYNGIKYVFYEREEYLLKDKTLYLLSKKEFQDLKKNVRVLFGGDDDGGLGLGLETKEEAEARAKEFFADLRKKTDKSEYFVSEDGKYAMLLAKPNFNSEDLRQAKDLVNHVNGLGKKILGDIPFHLAGRFADKVRDTRQIESDIAKTGLISLVGLFFILLWGLGSFRATYVTMGGVIISLGWATGLAKFTVGQINILTGFLLAILGGLGVEYGVHLIRRYEQEIKSGKPHDQALHTTYVQMGRTLFSAAITSACAFLILAFSDFRGFSELGIIAGLGVLSIYCSYMLCFPALGAFLREKPRFGRSRDIFGWYPASTKWTPVTLVVIAVILFGATRAEFEYDFARMHRLSHLSARMNQLSDRLFGKSLTPAALLATDKDQAQELRDWLQEEPRHEIIQQAVSTDTIVPDDMASRYRQIRKIRNEVDGLSDKEIQEKVDLSPARVREWLSAKPYGLSDLPEPFPSTFGISERIVYAYPAENLNQAGPLRRFTDLLHEGQDKFPGTQIGSDATVFVEIIEHIITDGKIVLLLFLVGSFFVFWLDFRSVPGALVLEMQLIFGMALLVGLMGLIGERFSILNVAMIPAVLAAGVDMGVHVRHRELEGHSALASAGYVAQAVQLSMLTTMMGFGALFFAEAGILKGIAWISVLGQFSMYLTCMIIVPVLKDGLWKKVRPVFIRAASSKS